MKRFQLYLIFINLSLIIILIAAPGLLRPVLASGPGTGGSKIRVNDEQVGSYTLLVATAPTPPTIGQMSVWVRVRDVETNKMRGDAVVMVEATPRTGGPTLTAQGTHKNAGNNFDYVAHLEIEDFGQWDFTIYVEDELGLADVSFTETISGGSDFTLLIGLAIPFVVLAVGVGIYLWRRSATGRDVA